MNQERLKEVKKFLEIERSIMEVMDEFDCHRATAYRWINKYSKALINEQMKNSHEEGNKKATSIVNANEPLTVDAVAEIYNINLKVWKKHKIKTNHWTMGDVVNYQTKVDWVEINKNELNVDEVVDNFENRIKHIKPLNILKSSPMNMTGRLYQINLFDTHIGKLAWEGECAENYDLRIAEKRIYEAIAYLASLVQRPEKILLVLGGDILHVINDNNTTSSGTKQDVDGRFTKGFNLAVEIFFNAINSLQKIAPVDVVGVEGNHGGTSEVCLYKAIECCFRGSKNVFVDATPKIHKYYVYGNSLLGLAHGDMPQKNLKQLPMIMATEAREDWGTTIHHNFFIGHLHSKRTIEFVINDELFCGIYRCRSIASADSWHTRSGYIGAKKGVSAFLHDIRDGIIAEYNFTV